LVLVVLENRDLYVDLDVVLDYPCFWLIGGKTD
jgi:hypothetical protein